MTERMDQTKFLGSVVKVIDDYTLVINKGSIDGVKKGDSFLVYFVESEEIKDLESGESLGQLEVVRGTGTAIHVQEKMTTIKSNRTISRGRVIRRTVMPSTLSANVMASFFGREAETVEEPEREAIPFESPKIGDKVKQI